MTIGQAIHDYRKAAGLTMKQLADRMQKNSNVRITPGNICKYEHDLVNPEWYTIMALAKELGPGFVQEALREYEK